MNPTGEPVIQAEELAKEAVLANEAAKRASADPLPGPARIAFCEGPIEVGGKTVYKVTPRHIQALKVVDSPLISIIQDAVQTGKIDTELPDEQAWEICWIFTHTGTELGQLIPKGRNWIKATSIAEVGETEFPVQLVMLAAMEQMKRYMALFVKHSAEAVEKGSVSFFVDSETPQNGAMGGS